MGDQKNSCKGLLEYLALHAGCMYLSDLRHPENMIQMKNIVRDIECGQYSVWEWNDAVYYITGREGDFQTQKEAKDFLIMYLAQ